VLSVRATPLMSGGNVSVTMRTRMGFERFIFG